MDWEDVCALALELDDVEETTSWGFPSLKVSGTWFAGMSPNKEARGALVVRCDPDERPLMLGGRPETFYVTPHYEGSEGFVLVRLEQISREELGERLAEARELALRRRRR